MVIAVGCDIFLQYLVIYNSVTKIKNIVKVKSLYPEDTNKIDHFFQDIKTQIDGKIDCFCVLMDLTYKNKFRKKFIQICKTQKNIKNVRIIGIKESKLLGAIENLSFLPETGDCLCIFDCRRDMIHYQTWKYNEENQWNFIDAGRVEKIFSGLDIPPFKSDLEELKLALKKPLKTPYICIFHTCVVHESEFKNVFPDYKKMIFEKSYKWAGWAMIYARFSLNEDENLKYKCDRILDRKLVVETLNETEISRNQILPFIKITNTIYKKGGIISISEEGAESESVEVRKGQISITFEIDINGIHSLTVTNMEKAKERMNKEIKNEFYLIPKKISDYNPEMHAVGIDLGTTECCAAVIRKNGPDFVVLDQTSNSRTMPSYVAFDESKPKCGQIVIDRMKYKADYTVYDSKRIIGRDFESISIDPLWPFKILKETNTLLLEVETLTGKHMKTIEEITSVLLRHIKVIVEAYQGRNLEDAVINIPTTFSEKQKQATKAAAEMVGWETVHFIPEPIAAAFAYFTEIDIPDKSNLLICDCGGGTVDICVAKISDGKLEVLSCDGDPYLGGRDFDKLLFNHFSAVLKHKYGFDVMKSSKKYVLKQKCQDIKHNLSIANEEWLDVDEFDQNIDDIIKITKKEFQEMSNNYMVKMTDIILRAITKASVPKHFIGYVFQVGGGCRMPMIKQMLKEIFPAANHQCSIHPEELVAKGAALYAYHLKAREQEKQKPTWFRFSKMF